MAEDWTKPYITLIDDCEQREQQLTDWERQFLDSIRKQLEEGRRLTQKQTDRLDIIWEKATSRG